MENVDVGLKGLSRSALPGQPSSEASSDGKVGIEVEVEFSEVCANLSPSHFVLINSVHRSHLPSLSSTGTPPGRADEEEKLASQSSASGVHAQATAALPTMLVSLRVKRVKLSLLETCEHEATARAHTFFALEHPSLSYGITDTGHKELACSVMKLGIVHVKAKVASKAAVVLDYYTEAKHLADGSSSMPQLHFQYTQPAQSRQPQRPAAGEVFLFLNQSTGLGKISFMFSSLSFPDLSCNGNPLISISASLLLIR